MLIVIGLDDPEWVSSLQTFFELGKTNGSEDVKISVVGNKNDAERVVTFDAISKAVDEYGLNYNYEVSSKTGHNIDETFRNIIINYFKC